LCVVLLEVQVGIAAVPHPPKPEETPRSVSPGPMGKVHMATATASYEPEEFETIAEVEVDSRGRVSLGRAGAEPGRRYRVEHNVDGVLLLIPVVSIPEREMIVWRNPELAAAVREGIEESERGETVDLGSFAEYAAEDDEDED
jgi:hypothetical protein